MHTVWELKPGEEPEFKFRSSSIGCESPNGAFKWPNQMLVPNRKLKCCMLMFHVCLPPLCTAYAVIPSVGFIIEKINSNEIVGCSTSTFDQDQVLSLPFLECFFYSIPFNLTFTALILVLLFMCYLAIDFPSDFFFLPSASPSPVFPTYSCQLTGSNIQLNCSLLAKTLSVSLYNW